MHWLITVLGSMPQAPVNAHLLLACSVVVADFGEGDQVRYLCHAGPPLPNVVQAQHDHREERVGIVHQIHVGLPSGALRDGQLLWPGREARVCHGLHSGARAGSLAGDDLQGQNTPGEGVELLSAKRRDREGFGGHVWDGVGTHLLHGGSGEEAEHPEI